MVHGTIKIKISKGHRVLKNRFIDNNFINMLKKISRFLNMFTICSHWQNTPQQNKVNRSLEKNIVKICFILTFFATLNSV